ncbi:hypothetical protein WJX82_000392 [Trebouxia sp. C0006]
MSVPGVSRRLADLIEASFPDKTKQRRNAREQDKLRKSEADWALGMLLSHNLWGNRSEWQEHDGALPTEGYRLLIPPGHPQSEDNPALPSPYTGSPGDSPTSPTRSPRQGLASPAGQAGSPAHRLTSARHRPYYRQARSDSLASDLNLFSAVLPRSCPMVDMSGYLRTLMNGRSAAAEQFGSELPERRGQPNGGHAASSAPAAAGASTVASRSEANAGHAHQNAPRNEDSSSCARPLSDSVITPGVCRSGQSFSGTEYCKVLKPEYREMLPMSWRTAAVPSHYVRTILLYHLLYHSTATAAGAPGLPSNTGPEQLDASMKLGHQDQF